jgi:hypothetical protein
MSVRAYKLIEIKTEKDPTFNCNETRITMLGDGQGDILSFNKEGLLEELEEVKGELKDPENQNPICQSELEDVKLTLETMIKECEGEDYVEYYCY